MSEGKVPDRSGRVAEVPGLFRPKDLVDLGLPKSQLARWLEDGRAEWLARGLYRRTDAEITELETVAMVCKRAPRAVVCLLTALHIHAIGTQAPGAVWIAVGRKSWSPRMRSTRLKVVRFAPRLLTYGVDERDVLGVTVRVTSPARTIVDCFRYRRKIGIDIAAEALRDAVRRRVVTIAQLDQVAEPLRMRRVMRPYLEALIE